MLQFPNTTAEMCKNLEIDKNIIIKITDRFKYRMYSNKKSTEQDMKARLEKTQTTKFSTVVHIYYETYKAKNIKINDNDI